MPENYEQDKNLSSYVGGTSNWNMVLLINLSSKSHIFSGMLQYCKNIGAALYIYRLEQQGWRGGANRRMDKLTQLFKYSL